MKLRYYILFVLTFLSQIVMACPVCDKRQPKVTMGLTHGVGPQSKWDWVIVCVMTVIVLVTLFYSIKFLVRPKESKNDHVKQSILSE